MATINQRLKVTLTMKGETCDLHTILSDIILTKNGIEAIKKEDYSVHFPFTQIVRYNGNKLSNEKIKEDEAKKYFIDVSQCKEGDVNFMLLCPPHTSEKVEFADEKKARDWQEYNWGTPFNAVSGSTRISWARRDNVTISFEIQTELSDDDMTFENVCKYIPRKWLESLMKRATARVVINGFITSKCTGKWVANIVQICDDVVLYEGDI